MGVSTPECLFEEFLSSKLLELKKTIAAEHLRLLSECEQQHRTALQDLQTEANHNLAMASLRHGSEPDAVGPRGLRVHMSQTKPPGFPIEVETSEPETDQEGQDVEIPEEKLEFQEAHLELQEVKLDGSQRLGSSEETMNGELSIARTSIQTQASRVVLEDVQQILLAAEKIESKPLPYASTTRSLAYALHQKRVNLVEYGINPLVCIVILLNAVTIGLSMDVEPDWVGWIVIDAIFVSVYLFEMMFKWRVLGLYEFFLGPSWAWNIFDFLIVVMSVGDVVLSVLIKDDDITSAYMLMRLIRLSRFGRILRLFEFDIFRELLTMLRGLVSGLRTLLWAFVLLVFPIYALGLALTSILGNRSDVEPAVASAVKNVPTSMFLVFRCTVGDCSLENGTPAILALTKEYGWVYGVIYILTTMLVTFGIFNLIMATFVDNALSAAKRNEMIRLKSRLNDKDRLVIKTSKLVHMLWKNQQEEVLSDDDQISCFDHNAAVNCVITKDVFDRTVEDAEAKQLLEDLDIPEEDQMGLFDVLDADGGGTLQLFEIIRGIQKLRGEPRRSDVVQVGLMVRCLQERVEGHAELMESQLEWLRAKLSDCNSEQPFLSKNGTRSTFFSP